MAVKKLNIQTCEIAYQGQSANGKQFTIYALTATDEHGVLIQHKLTTFEHLAPGLAEYAVKPYVKNGQVESYTVSSPRRGGGNPSAGASNALKSEVDLLVKRVEFLEAKIQEWAPLIPAIHAVIEQAHQSAQRTPAPTVDTKDLDDIPF